MKILITGGAGYKGCLLTQELLNKGNEVTVLDNFMYGHSSIMPYLSNPNFNAISKDIRTITESDLKEYDVIYHLAGISGYPACENNPNSAHMINVESTKRIVNLLGRSQKLIYASTTSFYGKAGVECDETSFCNPVSTYGITKLQAEEICMQKENSLALRFATIFGVTQRMRPDLLLNDFVYRAMYERTLVLFDSASKRTFIYVKDAIKSYTDFAHLKGIYNVGSNDMNFSKRELADMVAKHINFEIIEASTPDKDKRDFIINFNKIEKEGFKITVSMDEGIKELIKLYSFYNPYPVYAKI